MLTRVGDSKIDEAKAVEYFKIAAAGGNSDGQYHLGKCYIEGKGVPKNIGLAIEWLNKSSAQNNSMANRLLREYGLDSEPR